MINGTDDVSQFAIALENIVSRGEGMAIKPIPRRRYYSDGCESLSYMRYSDTEWSTLLQFVESNASFIRSRSHELKAFNNKKIEDYVYKLVLGAPTSPPWLNVFQEQDSLSHMSTQRECTQQLVDQAFFRLKLEEHDIVKVCAMFGEFCKSGLEEETGGASIADQLKDLIIKIAKDAQQCEVAIQDYLKATRSTYAFNSFNMDFEPLISFWATTFNCHKRRLQLSLAAYLSLGSFDSPISSEISLGFVISLGFILFPDLYPLWKNDMLDKTNSSDEIHKQNEGALSQIPVVAEEALGSQIFLRPPDQSISGIDAALPRSNEFPFYPRPGLSNETIHTPSDISVYSVASSRTDETDYGLYYRRMALSLSDA